MGRNRSEVDVGAEGSKVNKMNVAGLSNYVRDASDVVSGGAVQTKMALASVRFGMLKRKDAKLSFEKTIWNPHAETWYGSDKMDLRRREAPTGDKKVTIMGRYKHFVACGEKDWSDADKTRIAGQVIGAYELNAHGITVKAALLGALLDNETAPKPAEVQAKIDERAAQVPDDSFDIRAALKRIGFTVHGWIGDGANAKEQAASAKKFWEAFGGKDTKGKPYLSDKAKGMLLNLMALATELTAEVSASPEAKPNRDKVNASIKANAPKALVAGMTRH
jgi:hypothetical protein